MADSTYTVTREATIAAPPERIYPELIEPSAVDIDLTFEKPFKARNKTSFAIAPAGDGASRVTWTMTGQKTLMTRVMGIFKSMDSLVGPDFEKGLARLKATAESPPPSP